MMTCEQGEQRDGAFKILWKFKLQAIFMMTCEQGEQRDGAFKILWKFKLQAIFMMTCEQGEQRDGAFKTRESLNYKQFLWWLVNRGNREMEHLKPVKV